MKANILKRGWFAVMTLVVLVCSGCDSAGVYDIVLGSLRLAEGVVDVSV